MFPPPRRSRVQRGHKYRGSGNNTVESRAQKTVSEIIKRITRFSLKWDDFVGFRILILPTIGDRLNKGGITDESNEI